MNAGYFPVAAKKLIRVAQERQKQVPHLHAQTARLGSG